MLILFKKKKIVQILQTLWTTYDPHWDNVLFMLSSDTVPGMSKTLLEDFSINSWPVTNNGSVPVTNTQSKFGSTSLSFYGADSTAAGARYLTAQVPQAQKITTEDFTVEGWFYVNRYVRTGNEGAFSLFGDYSDVWRNQ